MDDTFFVLSKLARIFVDPGNLIFLLLAGSTVLVWWPWDRRRDRRARRVRAARVLLSIASILSILLVSLPAGQYFQTFLENRFPANPSLPGHVDGIIVLGGAVEAKLSSTRGQSVINDSAERLLAFARLARAWPEARTVFTGGSGSLVDQQYREADFVAPILAELGMVTENILFENRSRNTYENALFSKELVAPGPDEVWILITSAAHMPRAMGVFRMMEWPNIIPYPVDFRTFPEYDYAPPLNLTRGIHMTTSALWQAMGLLAYYLTGKTDALIPSP